MEIKNHSLFIKFEKEAKKKRFFRKPIYCDDCEKYMSIHYKSSVIKHLESTLHKKNVVLIQRTDLRRNREYECNDYNYKPLKYIKDGEIITCQKYKINNLKRKIINLSEAIINLNKETNKYYLDNMYFSEDDLMKWNS